MSGNIVVMVQKYGKYGQIQYGMIRCTYRTNVVVRRTETTMSGNAQSFWAGGSRHAQSRCIYAMLEDASFNLLQEGSSISSRSVPQDISIGAKTVVFVVIVRMFALACALINTPHG
eukprot:c17698_g1_i1 orf=106-453(+)